MMFGYGPIGAGALGEATLGTVFADPPPAITAGIVIVDTGSDTVSMSATVSTPGGGDPALEARVLMLEQQMAALLAARLVRYTDGRFTVLN